MSDQLLRDALGRIIGRVETDDDGRQVLRDTTYRIMGYFDPKDGTTRDPYNRIVGRGNILTSLLS